MVLGNINFEILYQFIIKIIISILCGLVIGINREMKQKAAGVKTNVLICLGATIYTYIGVVSMGDHQPADPNRIMAQIISGIGFLGAGAILRSGGGVVGLTTAASIWVVAAIGSAIGLGHYYVAVVGVAGVMIVLVIINQIYRLFSLQREYEFKIISDGSIKKVIYGLTLNSKVEVINIREKKIDDGGLVKSKIRLLGGKKEISKISSLAEEIDQVKKLKIEQIDS